MTETHFFVNPASELFDTHINTRHILVSAADSPGNDSSLVIMTFIARHRTDQWGTSITSTRILKNIKILSFRNAKQELLLITLASTDGDIFE